MRFTRAQVVPVLLLSLAAIGVVAVQSPAEAAVTSTNITSPADGVTHFLITNANAADPPSVTVTGTTNGAPGDIVDLYCFGVGSSEAQNGPQNVVVDQDGNFTATLYGNQPYGTCKLLAVPNGFTYGSSVAGFTGPRVTTEYRRTSEVPSGPNAGKTYDYDVTFQGEHAHNDIVSATNDGLWDARLTHPDGTTSNYLWSGVASLRTSSSAARSRVRVDGRDAYGPYSAEKIIAGDTPGGPGLTFNATRDGVTGVVTIRENNPLVRCAAGTAFPPTGGTCPSFTTAGVRLERSIIITDGGRQVHVTDVWRSTDGKSHTISAQYLQELHGYDYISASDTDVAFKLPWVGGFQTFTGDTTFPGPSTLANSILVRDSNAAPDGDIDLPRGALTFDFPTTVHRPAYDTLSLGASTFTVPAGSSRTVRQSFAIGTTDAEVAAKAAAHRTRINPYRADAQIKKSGTTTFEGNNVYNTTGASQYVSSNQKRSTTVTFVIGVQNDGTRTQTFRIKGTGAPAGFSVKYLAGLSGTTSVTSSVVQGVYGLRDIAPGKVKYLRLVVTVNPGASLGALRSWLVTATPVSDASRKDVVKALVKVVS